MGIKEMAVGGELEDAISWSHLDLDAFGGVGSVYYVKRDNQRRLSLCLWRTVCLSFYSLEVTRVRLVYNTRDRIRL
jgi:hypothetical protein